MAVANYGINAVGIRAEHDIGRALNVGERRALAQGLGLFDYGESRV